MQITLMGWCVIKPELIILWLFLAALCECECIGKAVALLPPSPLVGTFVRIFRGFGGAKVSCILRHWVIQLILAYSWARPAILVVFKGRGGIFLFLLFLHFHSCSSFFPVPLFHLLYCLISFLPFSGRRHKMTHKGWCVIKHQYNQSFVRVLC